MKETIINRSFTHQIVGFMFVIPAVYFFRGWLVQQTTTISDNYFFFINWGSIDVLHWLTLGVVFLWMKRKQLSIEDIGFTIREKKNFYFLFTYLLIATCLIFYLELFSSRTGPHLIGYRILWIFSCFTAGFCEELIWRGFFLSTLIHQNISKTVAVLSSSICFALMHGMAAIQSPFYFCFLFFFAVIYCVVFLRTQKLSLLMFIHMTYDLIYMFLYSLFNNR